MTFPKKVYSRTKFVDILPKLVDRCTDFVDNVPNNLSNASVASQFISEQDTKITLHYLHYLHFGDWKVQKVQKVQSKKSHGRSGRKLKRLKMREENSKKGEKCIFCSLSCFESLKQYFCSDFENYP